MAYYKGFNSDLTCKKFKYKIGETYEMECKPIICEQGFHFCHELKDVFEYYTLCKRHRFCLVDALGDITTDNRKSCTNKIKIVQELSLDEILDIIGIADKDLFKNYYNNELFYGFQLHEIMLGLKDNLDVSIYAKPSFDSSQMRELRLGLKDNLDVSIYARPLLEPYQMYIARRQLLEKNILYDYTH